MECYMQDMLDSLWYSLLILWRNIITARYVCLCDRKYMAYPISDSVSLPPVKGPHLSFWFLWLLSSSTLLVLLLAHPLLWMPPSYFFLLSRRRQEQEACACPFFLLSSSTPHQRYLSTSLLHLSSLLLTCLLFSIHLPSRYLRSSLSSCCKSISDCSPHPPYLHTPPFVTILRGLVDLSPLWWSCCSYIISQFTIPHGITPPAHLLLLLLTSSHPYPRKIQFIVRSSLWSCCKVCLLISSLISYLFTSVNSLVPHPVSLVMSNPISIPSSLSPIPTPHLLYHYSRVAGAMYLHPRGTPVLDSCLLLHGLLHFTSTYSLLYLFFMPVWLHVVAGPTNSVSAPSPLPCTLRAPLFSSYSPHLITPSSLLLHHSGLTR